MTLPIVVLTSIISILALYNQDWMAKSLFSPYIIKHRNEWHRFVTHALVHADWIHLFFNMYVLYTFGNLLEMNYEMVFGSAGKWLYLLMYVLAVVMSSIPAYEKNKNNSWYHAVGASGAVSAVVFAAILFNPTMGMGLIFIPISIPAFIFGLLYLGYSYYMSHRGGDNIAHDTHFFGALFGIMFTILLEREVGREFLRQIGNYFGS